MPALLIAEDEALIGIMLRDLFESRGYLCTVTGTLTEAQEAVRSQVFDAAVLDVKLRGQVIFPIAQALIASGVPCIFTTCHARSRLPAEFHSAMLFEKPFNNHDLMRAVSDAIGAKR